ncbi:MAG: DUF1311 domain-containing protein [Candidatus Hydrogenedentes bacterium]|nr:DUF1311 domain-containing protein [Candidatus Hydrogenedentota bacterium]
MKRKWFIVVGCAFIVFAASLGAEYADIRPEDTTLGMRIAAGESFEKADEELNAVYKELMASLDTAQQDAVRQAQRAWIAYKDAGSAAQGDLFKEGNLAPVVSMRAALNLTLEQIELLRSLLSGNESLAQKEILDPEALQGARKRAEKRVEKIYADVYKDEINIKSQKTWEAFRDSWVAAEIACRPAYEPTLIKDYSLTVLNNTRAEELKTLFMSLYEEEEDAGEAAGKKINLAADDPPLMKAVSSGNLEAVKQLIERGANVNETNSSGWTALHVAAEEGTAVIAVMLLRSGARTDLYDFNERTASDIAWKNNHLEVAQIIDEYNTTSKGAEPAQQQPTQAPVAEKQQSGPEVVDLRSLLDKFSNLTDLQQEKWSRDNEWKLIVSGSGEVSEVETTSWLSEISDAAYEVTCELSDGNRAILFMDENHSDFIYSLDIGDTINFTGKLKTIKEWPFWCTGYVKVD